MGFFISGGGSAVASPISDFKDSVRVATTANITLSGLPTIDGVALNANDRVLVKNQTAGQDNGIYLASSGAWSRSPDADSDSEVTSGMIVAVTEGTTFGGKIFVLTTPDPISLGVTSLVFQPYGVEIDPLSLHINGDNSMSGHIVFQNDNTYDLGTSNDGTTLLRPRDVRVGRNVLVGDNVIVSPTATAAYFTEDKVTVIGQGTSIVSNNATAGTAYLSLRRANGTIASRTAVSSGNTIAAISAMGFNGSTYQEGAAISAIATQNFSGSAAGTRLVFSTAADGGTASQRWEFSNSGDFRTASTSPHTYIFRHGALGTNGTGIELRTKMPAGGARSFYVAPDVTGVSFSASAVVTGADIFMNLPAFSGGFVSGLFVTARYPGTGAANPDAFQGANGVTGRADASGGVLNIGLRGHADGADNNFGVFANSTAATNSGRNIAVAGYALNTGTSPTQIGGYFTLRSASNPPYPTVNAALVADNGATTHDIAKFQDNGTDVWRIADGGDLLSATDGGVNIGSDSANRPNFVYAKTEVNVGNSTLIRSNVVSVGNITPDASAVLQADSDSKGFLPPRMTTAQRTGISSPAVGLMVFDTDADAVFVNTSVGWKQLSFEP